MCEVTHKIVACQYPDLGECWECTSHKTDAFGYPRHSVNGKAERIYRTVFRKKYGEIPSGMVVRHKCDNPACINPDHLELGTYKENAMDREVRGRNKSVLSIDDVQVIKNSCEENSALARKFGIARVTVWQIKTGRRYAWV